jgi:hypothetical protein
MYVYSASNQQSIETVACMYTRPIEQVWWGSQQSLRGLLGMYVYSACRSDMVWHVRITKELLDMYILCLAITSH